MITNSTENCNKDIKTFKPMPFIEKNSTQENNRIVYTKKQKQTKKNSKEQFSKEHIKMCSRELKKL